MHVIYYFQLDILNNAQSNRVKPFFYLRFLHESPAPEYCFFVTSNIFNVCNVCAMIYTWSAPQLGFLWDARHSRPTKISKAAQNSSLGFKGPRVLQIFFKIGKSEDRINQDLSIDITQDPSKFSLDSTLIYSLLFLSGLEAFYMVGTEQPRVLISCTLIKNK